MRGSNWAEERARTQTGLDRHHGAAGVKDKLRKESRWALVSAHRHRLKQPTPQGVEAIAAFERDEQPQPSGAFRLSSRQLR